MGRLVTPVYGVYRPWFLSIFLIACAGQKHEEAGLLFKNWYVVKPYVAGGGSVAYGSITNTSTEPVTLKGADFACASGTALHETITTGDRVTMSGMAEAIIAAGGTVVFEPGHKHIMLTGIKNADDPMCSAGFTFHSKKIRFDVPVKPREK